MHDVIPTTLGDWCSLFVLISMPVCFNDTFILAILDQRIWLCDWDLCSPTLMLNTLGWLHQQYMFRLILHVNVMFFSLWMDQIHPMLYRTSLSPSQKFLVWIKEICSRLISFHSQHQSTCAANVTSRYNVVSVVKVCYTDQDLFFHQRAVPINTMFNFDGHVDGHYTSTLPRFKIQTSVYMWTHIQNLGTFASNFLLSYKKNWYWPYPQNDHTND